MLTLLTAMALAVQPFGPVSVGNWRIESRDQADVGRFCGATAQYNSGVTLIFSQTERDFSVNLFNDQWAIPQNAEYRVSLNVDNRLAVEARAVALPPNGIRIGYEGYPRTLVEALRYGYALTIRAQGGEFEFSLDDTIRALQVLDACVNSRTRQNPFAGTTEHAENPFEQGEREARVIGVSALDISEQFDLIMSFHERLGGAIGESFEVLREGEDILVVSDLVSGYALVEPYARLASDGQTFEDIEAYLTGRLMGQCEQVASRQILYRPERFHAVRLIYCDGEDLLYVVSCEADTNCYIGFYQSRVQNSFAETPTIEEVFAPLIASVE